MNTEREQILLEIAAALVGGSSTFFLGTGFSKFLTNGKAPSWLNLLADCAKMLREDITEELFEYKRGRVTGCKYDLTICAQILEDQFRLAKKDIRRTVSRFIKRYTSPRYLDSDKVKKVRDFFAQFPRLNIITTNYDDIVSSHLVPESRVYVEGALLPKIADIKAIYHVHGTVTNPETLILTQDDYFRFQHKESYVSRKLFTLLQETSTVILGYSLQDFNLNRILNEAKYSKGDRKRSDIFYVSRNSVDELSKRYYFSTFGIQVLDDLEIDEFIADVEGTMEEAATIVKGAKRLPNIISGDKEYKDEFLKLSRSFMNILMRLQAGGYNITDNKVQNLLISILKRKRGFTQTSGAWSQYAHLAEWLIELGSLLDITDDEIKEEYKSLIVYSLRTMSGKRILGQSWAAYDTWLNQIHRLTTANKKLVRDTIKKHFAHTSARNLLPSLET